MKRFLAEPPTTVYIVLIVIAAAGVLAWLLFRDPPRSKPGGKNQGSRRFLFWIIALVAVVAALGLRVADFVLESDREQIHWKLGEMSNGVRERNMTKVFAHISEQFSVQGMTKGSLRKAAETHQQQGNVSEVKIWDIVVEPIPAGATEAQVRFQFKVEGNWNREGAAFFRCKSKFVRDPDGEWRLKSFEVFPPTGDSSPMQIPGI